MLEFTEVDMTGTETQLTATLKYADRQKSRLRITLDSGETAGILLTRGSKLRSGNVLTSASGERLRIVAALESVSVVSAYNQHAFARLCYHLGNRHVPVEIGDGWACYERDHVLDEMVAGLGFDVIHEDATFEHEMDINHEEIDRARLQLTPRPQRERSHLMVSPIGRSTA